MRPPFPFAAISGQQDMKLALLSTAVDPDIGGVLVLGDRGTGKSTAIRALAALLPTIRVVKNCRYNCDPDTPESGCLDCGNGSNRAVKIPVPVVDLPLGATEDRVVGALDLERALSHGQKQFEPGLLARANRGYLYVDEVNLLEDHLVDLLLDAAASGESVVEREGLSVRHAARFVLIGSGNPEEGELRPQLLDRFGLAIEVTTPTDVKTRVDVIKNREAYERDPVAFCDQYKRANSRVRSQITKARKLLDDIAITDSTRETIAEMCIRLGTDGLRGEITLTRAARANAALSGETQIRDSHITAVAAMALSHRLRRDPLDESGSRARVDRVVSEVLA